MKKSLALFVGLIGILVPGSALAASYTFNINSSLAGYVQWLGPSQCLRVEHEWV